MLREELVFVGTCDIAGHVRGKGFPAREIDARRRKGIGWTHSNLMQTAFGPIFDTPFGTGGDLMIVPDPAAEVRVDFADGSRAGTFLPRRHPQHRRLALGVLPARVPAPRPRRAGGRRAGLRLIAAFEQEFVYTGNRGSRRATRTAWARSAARAVSARASSPRCAPPAWRRTRFLPEYGDAAVRGDGGAGARADRRRPRGDHPRDGARRGAPAGSPRDVLADARGGRRRQRRAHPHEPARGRRHAGHLCDRRDRWASSMPAQQFCAGVLHHLPAIAAITAPSPVSYLRLTPNRWAPTLVDIVQQDRGAALRVCPVFAAGRARRRSRGSSMSSSASCDAAASPYMALGAVLFAGADGLRRKLALPASAGGAAVAAALAGRGAGGDGGERRGATAGSVRCSWRPICATSARSWPIRRSSQ